MTAVEQALSGPDADQLPNLDPQELARMALGSLGYVVRHHRQNASVIELTSAHICLLGGANELRRVAETAIADENDSDGQVLSLLLLNGFWRSNEARHAHA